MRRANHLRVGIAGDDLWDRSYALGRAVPLPVGFIASVNLDKLREVHIRAERIFDGPRSEEHTSELQSRLHLVCRLLLEKKKKKQRQRTYNQQRRDRQ